MSMNGLRFGMKIISSHVFYFTSGSGIDSRPDPCCRDNDTCINLYKIIFTTTSGFLIANSLHIIRRNSYPLAFLYWLNK